MVSLGKKDEGWTGSLELYLYIKKMEANFGDSQTLGGEIPVTSN